MSIYLNKHNKKKMMKKYKVVQKLWGFYGSGAGEYPKRGKYCKKWGNLKKGLLIYDINCYKCYIHILVLLVESKKKKKYEKIWCSSEDTGVYYFLAAKCLLGRPYGFWGCRANRNIVISFEQ